MADDDKPKVPTSYAKTLDLQYEKNALDRALKLQKEFERAKAAQEKIEQRQNPRKPERENAPKTPTSYAKTLDLKYEKNALDDAPKLQKEFERAKAAQEKIDQRQNTRNRERGRDNTPRYAPTPETHLRPVDKALKPDLDQRSQNGVRREVDKEIDAEKMAKEDERARKAMEIIRERQEQRSRDRDNDRGRNGPGRSR